MLTNNLTTFPTVADAARPAYLTPSLAQTDYGTKITRIAGDYGVATPLGGLWGHDARHHYSKDQPWNDDGTMIWIEQRSATPSKLILDATTLRPIIGNKNCSRISANLAAAYETRWRPGYPTQMVSWIKSSQTLVVWDVLTDKVIWSTRIPSPDPDFGFISENVLSDDGRYVVVATHYPTPMLTGKVDYFQVVDLVGHLVGPQNVWAMDYTTADSGDVDWVSISPLGNYVVVKYSSNGKPEYSRVFHRGSGVTLSSTGLVYSPQIMSSTGLRMWDTLNDRYGWIACLSHADFNITPAGKECLVGGIRDASHAGTRCSSAEVAAKGYVIAVDLATGVHTHVSAGTDTLPGGVTEAEDQHTSGRCYKKRGWHLVTYSRDGGVAFQDEMVLWKLDGSHDCIRFGITRTNDASPNYRAEAHGVPSPDGTKVMFASNWGFNASPVGAVDDIKSYIIQAA